MINFVSITVLKVGGKEERENLSKKMCWVLQNEVEATAVSKPAKLPLTFFGSISTLICTRCCK